MTTGFGSFFWHPFYTFLFRFCLRYKSGEFLLLLIDYSDLQKMPTKQDWVVERLKCVAMDSETKRDLRTCRFRVLRQVKGVFHAGDQMFEKK